jgi:hypothetical protein
LWEQRQIAGMRIFSGSGVLSASVSSGYGEAILLIIVVRGPPKSLTYATFLWSAIVELVLLRVPIVRSTINARPEIFAVLWRSGRSRDRDEDRELMAA